MPDLLIRSIVFAAYVAGVTLITRYTPIMRLVLGTPIYLVFLLLYLLGVSKAAELIGGWLRVKLPNG